MISINFPKQNGTAIVTVDEIIRKAIAPSNLHFSGAASTIRFLNSDDVRFCLAANRTGELKPLISDASVPWWHLTIENRWVLAADFTDDDEHA